MDLEQKRLAAQLAAGRLNLLRFADLFGSIAGLRVAGITELEVESEIMLDPFNISSIRGRSKGSALTVAYGSFQFQNVSDQKQIEKLLVIDFEKSGGPDWCLKLSYFATTAPLAARIADMAATVQPHADQFEFSGNLKLSFEPSADAIGESVPIRFNKPFNLPLEFSGRYSNSDAWQLDLAGRAADRSEHPEAGFDYDEFHIAMQSPEVSLTGSSREGKISAVYKLQVPDVQISSERGNIFLPKLVLTGETWLGGEEARSTTSIIDLEISGSKLTSNTLRFETNRLAADCTLRIDAAGVRRVDGYVKFDGGI